MAKLFAGFDWTIFICVLILCGLGGATIASVAPEFFISQFVFYILGLGLFFLFSQIDFRVYYPLKKIIYLISLVLLGITLLIGLETRGAMRWIPIGPAKLQFSEILKPLLVTVFASVLVDLANVKKFFDFWKIFPLLLLPILLVFKQPDLGSAMIYFSGLAAMVLVSRVRIKYLLSFFLPAVLGLPVLWKVLASYQKARLTSFFSPHADPLGASYNAIQAMIAVGSGMIWGKGLGHGTQSHLLFLPEHHTDFIFAAISEELGFLGAAFVVVLYFIIIWRIFNIALSSGDDFGKLILVGTGSFLFVQVFVNVGMNLGMIPVTGVTLPLLSYGGSSLISTMIALGMVENIARS